MKSPNEVNPQTGESSRLDDLLKQLELWFKPHEGTLTAFSGGVDSALVLYLSKRFLGNRGMGVVADSPSLKRSDLELAKSFCEQFGISLRVIQTDELENADYGANPPNRCYFCKSNLYQKISDLRKAEFPAFQLLNGTNQDDRGDYRPGLLAADEQTVLSPLAACNVGKAEVRSLAKHLGIPVWNKPASPCLSSRIPYGQSVTKRKLSQIELAEAMLNRLGFEDVRVRHYGELARVEVPAESLDRLREVSGQVEAELLSLGFSEAQIDSEGLVSGKLNRVLKTDGLLQFGYGTGAADRLSGNRLWRDEVGRFTDTDTRRLRE